MNLERLIDFLKKVKRVISIFKLPFEIKLAKISAAMAVLLIVGSQVGLNEVLLVYVIEKIWGKSPLLENAINNGGDAWLGVLLLILTMVYYILIHSADKFIEGILIKYENRPVLESDVLDIEEQSFSDNVIQINRINILTPKIDTVPDYNEFNPNSSFLNMAVFSNENNKDFFRRRAAFLAIYGGAEIIFFKIENKGKKLGTGISLEVEFFSESNEELSDIFSCIPTDDYNPEVPEKRDISYMYANILNSPSEINYVSMLKNPTFIKRWNIGELQAGTYCRIPGAMIINAKEAIEMLITIYCNEFDKPISREYKIIPSEYKYSISMNEIENDEKFNQIVSDYIIVD
ncbi:hypothetical protein [Celerinatantimonas sp. YJH-8]|uniref:hypothetical protein n=1 Tax=Celerinatantimonas sp. YJH-8 TaxID=3228714 RepID=UPI0038CBB663